MKKLFIKVFTSDGSAKSLLVDEKMSVGQGRSIHFVNSPMRNHTPGIRQYCPPPQNFGRLPSKNYISQGPKSFC